MLVPVDNRRCCNVISGWDEATRGGQVSDEVEVEAGACFLTLCAVARS